MNAMTPFPSSGSKARHRQPLTGARLIIVISAIGFALFLLWASLAQVDEVKIGRAHV